LAYSHDRGRSWTQFAGNPVLDLGLTDFRDPKVFWHADTRRWIMLVSLAHEYRLAFFASNNLKDWVFLSDFKSEDTQHGIWECPDIFEMPLAGEAAVWVLKVDVLEGHPSQGSGARLFVGHFDGTRFLQGNTPAPAWADYGADFYAAVAWGNTEHVRPSPVWIGWMNCHRYAKHLPTRPWRGAMSMPRAISLRRTAAGLEFLQQPVPELNQLRGAMLVSDALEVKDSEHPLPVNSITPSLELHLVCEEPSAQAWGGYLRTGPSEWLRWGYDAKTSSVFVDRSESGFIPDDPHYAQRQSAAHPGPQPDEPLRLRVYLDHSSIELFVGDGDLVLTAQFFPLGSGCEVGVFSTGGTTRFAQVRAWPLEAAL
jgi:fructan beta-fructosidase